MDNEEWIEGKLPEEPEGSDFESHLWLSTDGKMTVEIVAKNSLQRKQGGKYAKEMYFWLKENFGSKQAFASKEYKQADSDLGTCPKCSGPMALSQKGKPYCKNVCWKK